jgi:hypothetical protein
MARVQDAANGDAADRVRMVGAGEDANGGKSLVQLQAERMAETRFADMMSSAGVPVTRMALESLYFLPRDFVNAYAEMFTTALTGDDGGAGAKGKAGERTAALGRAERKTHGGGGKKYKKYWVVADERALELKERIDKRLRSIAREVMTELQGGADGAGGAGESGGVNGHRVDGGRTADGKCAKCHRFCAGAWKFCANCGSSL